MKKINILLLSLLFLLLGCGTSSDPIDVDYGSDYLIIVTQDRPSVVGNTLRVVVFYNGCEPNHEFEVNTLEGDNNEYEVWLRKITPNQDCELSFEESREFELPAETNQSRIRFSAPNFEGILREI
ncbi:MAG: hypothetical protein JJU37_11865 [Balneolaceae bacterium]|nr:hypothetical protein [Balneolaceae bacterium]